MFVTDLIKSVVDQESILCAADALSIRVGAIEPLFPLIHVGCGPQSRSFGYPLPGR
jgi:hypothetical protein